MKLDVALRREIARVALGVAVLVALMIGVYAVIGRLTDKVVLGGLYTGALGILNFLAMGLMIQRITDRVAEKKRSDEEIETLSKQMKARMQVSYTLRMVALFGLVVVGITVLKFDPLATILPLVFPRLIVGAMQLKGKSASKGSDKNGT